MNYKKLAYPYFLWSVLLIIIPLIYIFILSISITNGLSLSGIEFTSQNFFKALEPIYVKAMFNSLFYGAISTLICLLIGYPIAYFIAFSRSKYKNLLTILILLPTWNSMLLRILAWEKLFLPNSILNMFGISLDLIGTPIAIIIAMVSIYLPFMILPIITVLRKINPNLLEASTDLYSTKKQTFFRVTLPLSVSGIISGFIMTFLPAATAFAIPERMSGGKILLIGNIIENQFMNTFNYNFGAMISLLIVIIIIVSMLIINRFDSEGETLL